MLYMKIFEAVVNGGFFSLRKNIQHVFYGKNKPPRGANSLNKAEFSHKKQYFKWFYGKSLTQHNINVLREN